MKLMTFTVPCYNSAEYMHICVDSLLKGGDEVEIIIIDDGSKDDTGKIADAYAEKYPNIVRVIHQENGGHGEGINQGIRHANGKYFKVVDSDDWVNENALKAVLHKLNRLEAVGGVDLMVCNYVYEHADPKLNSTIRYGNVFPEGKVVSWKDTKPFLISQYLTLHSAIFRTQVLRDSGVVLPKHIFYEDNLFVYTPLPLVRKICYLNQDFYRYLIGREGQSVAEEVMKKRWTHQMQISKSIFLAHDIEKIKKQDKKLARYMYHETMCMLAIAAIFTRLCRTPETEQAIADMETELTAAHPVMGKKLFRRSPVYFLTRPGKLGCNFCIWFYHLAHKVVKFN